MKILIAYDGSEAAGHALTRAGQIALRGGEVTVISVVPLQASGPRSAGPVMSGDVEEHKRELNEAVAKLKEMGVDAQRSRPSVTRPRRSSTRPSAAASSSSSSVTGGCTACSGSYSARRHPAS